jgi:hypothetical protein
MIRLFKHLALFFIRQVLAKFNADPLQIFRLD